MIKRNENGQGIKFDPVGLFRLAIEIVVIIGTIYLFFGNMTSALAVHSTEIVNLRLCDARLEKKIDDTKIEQEVQLKRIEDKIDRLLERQK